ncbi:MAG: hypothetical protein KDD37_02360 [Bdellovibrionales bacterium]|nr:hypothetical protein [Bdellovibrionales bacterium]
MLGIVLAFIGFTFADTPYENYKARSSDRWTIANWFETKRQVRLMDQWLSRHRKSKNIMDLDLSFSYLSDETKTKNFDTSTANTSTDYYGGNFAFYLYFIGVEAEYYEDVDESENRHYAGSAHIRLLGTSNQTTRISIFYGKEFIENMNLVWHPTFYGARLTVYITNFLGIEGTYQKYIEEDTDLDYVGNGDKKDFSVFVDIYFLRLFAKWVDENREYKNQLDQTQEEDHKGFEAGLRFYF